MTTHQLIIKTPPISVNKLYQGRRFLTREGKATKEMMALEAGLQYKKELIQDDVAVDIKFYFKDKRGMDIDGALKGLLDCLTGVVWKDDRQIKRLTVSKLIDKSSPRTEMIIKPMI
jgi:crossover junction endodeoxyribonuclease RusA